MGRYTVTPAELESAAGTLASVEREMSIDNLDGAAGLSADSVGHPRLAGALHDMGDRLGMVASAFEGVVTSAGTTVGNAGRSYESTEQATAASFAGGPR